MEAGAQNPVTGFYSLIELVDMSQKDSALCSLWLHKHHHSSDLKE